ncbi:MAG: S8 family serine peptidase, partial [Candidatus Pacearchaeota archaeon]|nr:S8 family serine peptidase [Candidatus Pacearchaeota archaeon]
MHSKKEIFNKILLSISVLLVLTLFLVSAQNQDKTPARFSEDEPRSFSIEDFFPNEGLEISEGNEFQNLINFQNPEEEQFRPTKQQKENALLEIEEELSEKDNVNIIVWLKDKTEIENVISDSKVEATYVYNTIGGFAGSVTEKQIRMLSKDERVNYFALDQEVRGLLPESRPLINASLVESTYGLTGQGIGVCHLDTGINYTHPQLAHAYVGGYDFVNNDPDPYDDNGHGTATAGIVALSNHAQIRGVAPNVSLAVVKVLNSQSLGSSSQIIAGIDWCVSNKNQYNIKVITMSLGTPNVYTPESYAQTAQTFEPALQSAYNNKIAIVAGSGNAGSTSGISAPAISPYVISVGATLDRYVGSPRTWTLSTGGTCVDQNTSADYVTCFGNRASFLDIMAPGAIIMTTNAYPTIPFQFVQTYGTSSSTAFVTGTIALMAERNPTLTPYQ